MTRDAALRLLKENLKDIMIFGVKSIGIFGSISRNEADEHSDLDILVEYETGRLNLDTYMDLKYYLEKLFKRRVDLVTKSSMKEYSKDKILKEVVYAA